MSEERLKLDRETANEALIPAPRDHTYPPKYTPPPTQTLREILLADPFFGFYMRYYTAKERKQ